MTIMKPEKIKSEKEKSPSEILKSIDWEKVEFDYHSAWFKSSYGVTDMQVKVLEMLLTKSLSDRFELADNEVFHFRGQVSFTVFIKMDHPFWDEYGGSLEDYLTEDFSRLFNLK